MGFRPFLAAIGQQTLCLEPVFKAHLRPEQLQGSRASDWMLPLGQPRSIEMDQQKLVRSWRAALIGARTSRGCRREATAPA